MFKFNKNKKGFTLIELLVVIAIIGLLSTLAVFSLNSARTKARDAKRMSDMKMLSTAMEMYATEKGSYTDGLTGCTSNTLYTCDSIQYGGETLLDLSSLRDPSNVTGNCGATNDISKTCEYAKGATVSDTWSVCFYLEKPIGNLGSGLHAISEGGAIHTITGEGGAAMYCR